MHYSKRYDSFGEHDIMIEGKTMTDVGDGDDVYPKAIDALHRSMMILWALAQDLHSKGRKIPLTVKEAESLIKPKQLRQLSDEGYVSKQVLVMQTKESQGKNVGSRACVCLTEKGRRYARRNIDEEIQRNSEQPGSDSAGVLGGSDERADSHPV